MVCSLEDGKEKDGTPYVKIPYFGEDGKPKVTRKRMGPHKFKWGFGSAGNMLPYGLWRKEGLEIAGSCILVEGESDAQTLWFLGYPALGIPGASTFKPEWAESLKGIEMLYIHKEPDQGGQTFLDKVAHALKDAGFDGGVETFSCADGGQKDPSRLVPRPGQGSCPGQAEKNCWQRRSPWTWNTSTTPSRWRLRAHPRTCGSRPAGSTASSESAASTKGQSRLVCVCRTPIILTKRLKKTDTGGEKMRSPGSGMAGGTTRFSPLYDFPEPAALRCWRTRGRTVTSENAKQVVRFLGASEQENIDALGLQGKYLHLRLAVKPPLPSRPRPGRWCWTSNPA
ncbi:MAG: hypothetical protein ACLTGJ_02295 [Faecalibacterium prausnitzii]